MLLTASCCHPDKHTHTISHTCTANTHRLENHHFTCTCHKGNSRIVSVFGCVAIEERLLHGRTGVLLLPNVLARSQGRVVVPGHPTIYLSAHNVGSVLVPSGRRPRQPGDVGVVLEPHAALTPTSAAHKHLPVGCRGHRGYTQRSKFRQRRGGQPHTHTHTQTHTYTHRTSAELLYVM